MNAEQPAAPAVPEEDGALQAQFTRMEQAMDRELFTRRIAMARFNLQTYAAAFESYAGLFRPALAAFREAAAADPSAAAQRLADLLYDGFLAQLQRERSEGYRELFDCRFTITSLTIPALLEQKLPAAEQAADLFLARWNRAYPKRPLGKATYKQICDGFHKKFCYITTAACVSLGRGEDCPELGEFRAFRDRWLARTPSGRAKIAEYYLFAPLVVEKIGRSGRARDEYRRVWDRYLAPCLADLRAGDRERCAARYEEMVCRLERKWLSPAP